MVVNQPHFLLFCDAHLSKSRTCAINDRGFGRWHFVLERLDGPERFEAADSESEVHRDRLALLAVVRGLEALEQPSHVTLVTTSRYVSRGLRYGLNEWREAEYTWEHFGVQKPIRNADLWQRIDSAMTFHQVTCRLLQSPLAQAIVDTAEELDELTVLSHPIDTLHATPTDVETNETKLAAAVGRRAKPSGIIQRVDGPHQGMAHQGESRRPKMAAMVASEDLGDRAEVDCNSGLGTLGDDEPKHQVIDQQCAAAEDVDYDEVDQGKPNNCEGPADGDTFDFQRPKIRLTIPSRLVEWWQRVVARMQALRTFMHRRLVSPNIAPT
jgi:ribonuclease HI